MSESSSRIVVVDALRGFAVMAIMLLHFIEHFIYGIYPTDSPAWLASLDKGTGEALFFLFAGKSYSIFALLFGFTFAIQNRNQLDNGREFRGRFLWRMLLLLIFGTLNAAFFPGGDVLVLFALMGVVMVPVRKWSVRALIITALVFLAQPLEIYYSVRLWIDPSWQVPRLLDEACYPALLISTGSGNFLQMVWANITTGQVASLFWAADAGRLLQAPGLFILGMVLVRKNYFSPGEDNGRFWTKVTVYSIIAAFILYLGRDIEGLPAPASTILEMWYNVAFTGILVGGFVLLYNSEWFRTFTNGLRFYGKMSLTNYVSQSIIGSLIFFPYALNLAPHAGMTVSFLMGLAVLFFQIGFCKWWLSRNRMGPLEGLWHKATWINSR